MSADLSTLAVGAGLLAVVGVLALMLSARAVLIRAAYGARVQDVLGGRTDGQAEGGPQIADRLNQTISRQGFADGIARSLGQANIPLTVPEYLLLRVSVPLLLALLALLLWRDLMTVPPAVLAGLVAPSFWVARRRRQRNRLFDEQLPETLTMITASLRGGFSLLQALGNATKETIEPTKSELYRVTQEVQLGLSLTDALNNLVRRVESDDLDLVVSAIQIQARVGGNLTAIFENICTTIREREKLRREIGVITAMQRISSYIIGALPFVLGLIILALNPNYILRLFTPGWTLCLPIGGLLFAVMGFVIMRRVIDIKV